jgi:hypothetical protein
LRRANIGDRDMKECGAGKTVDVNQEKYQGVKQKKDEKWAEFVAMWGLGSRGKKVGCFAEHRGQRGRQAGSSFLLVLYLQKNK